MARAKTVVVQSHMRDKVRMAISGPDKDGDIEVSFRAAHSVHGDLDCTVKFWLDKRSVATLSDALIKQVIRLAPR